MYCTSNLIVCITPIGQQKVTTLPFFMEIFFALRRDAVEMIEAECEIGIDMNGCFEPTDNKSIPELLQGGAPWISVASYFGSIKCLNFMKEHGIDVEKEHKDMRPIHYAIAGGNLNAFKFFVDAEVAKDGVVTFCVIFNQMTLLRYIFTNKLGDPNERFQGKSAIDGCKTVSCMRLLLEAGARFTDDFWQKNRQSEFYPLLNEFRQQMVVSKEVRVTPLHTACDAGDIAAVKRILEEGTIDVNGITENEDTALIKAAHRGSLEIVKLLLQNPTVDINHANKGGKTALHEAALRGKKDVVVYLLSCHGINPFLRTTNGRTALHCAARRCKVDIIDALLSTGQLHPNQQDDEGDTALHIAVRDENVPVIHRFLQVPGVKFNIRNKGGRAAFDLAPRKFVAQFRPRMDEIIAAARAAKQAEKKAKR